MIPTKDCMHCKNQFIARDGWDYKKRKFCNSSCSAKYNWINNPKLMDDKANNQSIRMKRWYETHESPMKGRENKWGNHAIETKLKMSLDRKGVHRTAFEKNCLRCKKEFMTTPSNPKKFCSYSCSSKYCWDSGLFVNRNGNFYKGMIPHNKNKPVPEEQKIRQARTLHDGYDSGRLKHPNLGKHIWENRTHPRGMLGKKCSEEHIRKALRRRPMSSLEVKFNSIIQKYNLPYKFVGNGEFLIGRKCPDFINTNGEKIAVEVFYKRHKATFTHQGIKQFNLSRFENWKSEREEIFQQYNWKILFFDAPEVTEENILKQLCYKNSIGETK